MKNILPLLVFLWVLAGLQCAKAQNDEYAKAIQLISEKKYEEAINGLNKAIDQKPDSLSYFVARGGCYFELKKWSEAAKDYSKVIAKKGESADTAIYNKRGQANFNAKAFLAAGADFDFLSKKNPVYPYYYYQSGVAYARGGDSNKAIKALKMAIQSNFMWPEAHMELGRLYSKLNDTILAAQELSIAENQAPKSAEVQLAWADFHLALGSWGDVEDRVSKALKLDPTLSGIYTLRGQARIQIRRYPAALEDLNKAIELDPKNAAAYLYRAMVFDSMHKLTAMEADLKKAAEFQKDLAPLLMYRGELGLRFNKFEQAINEFEGIRENDPLYFKAQINKANAHFELKQYAEAQVIVENLIGKKEFLPEAYLLRGKIFAENKAFPQANDDLTMAAKLKPYNGDALMAKGRVLVLQGEFVKAIAVIDSGLLFANAANPNRIPAYFNRAFANEKLDKYEYAAQDYSRILEINPDNIRALKGRANAAMKRNSFQLAEKDYERMIMLNNSDAEAYLALGKIKARLTHYNQAIEQFTKAVEIQSNMWEAYLERGRIQFTLRNWSAGEQDCLSAAENSPGNGEPYYLAGLSIVKNGDKSKGCNYLHKAIELGVSEAVGVLKANCP